MTTQDSKRSERFKKTRRLGAFFENFDRTSKLVSTDAVEGADRTSATVTASPAPARLINPCVTSIYDTTKPNQVGLSVIQITNLSKHFK